MDEKNKEKIDLIKKSFEFKHLKKYKEAIELIYKALEYNDSDIDNVELLAQAGELHILLGNYDRALDEFQKALSIDKNHNYSKLKCFEIYLATGKIEKALDAIRKICEDNPNSENYFYYFKALIQAEKYQDAIEIFNSLDDSIKFDPDILYTVSTINGDKRKILLERILEIDPAHQRANLDLARIEFKARNWDKVIRYCLNLDENNPLGVYYLACTEANRNNFSRAIELFIKAINLDNDEHDFYLDLAKAYIDSSDFYQGLEALKLSINYSLIRKDKSRLDEKYFLAGWILIKEKEYTKALLNLNSINSDSRLYNNAQILIQTINLKRKNLSEAKINLEKYYEKDKSNPILLESLAEVYKELKLYKKSIEIYRRTLQLYPNSIYYTLELIDLLIDERNYEEAMSLINSISEKYSNCASIYNSLARIYYRLNDLNSALGAINRYIELDRNKAEAYYFKGLILNDLSQFEEAKQFIYTAIRLNPSIAKYYSQMARAYSETGDFESALLYAKEAIEIDKHNIKYKKQAYEIALKTENKEKISIYESMLKRSEYVLKAER